VRHEASSVPRVGTGIGSCLSERPTYIPDAVSQRCSNSGAQRRLLEGADVSVRATYSKRGIDHANLVTVLPVFPFYGGVSSGSLLQER